MDGTPFIPEQITVHLGTPDSNAPNVTVSFPDYIKNVISSEIYPTWPENSMRANIYAAVSFALNRIYTEWYRSRGYDFDITNSTQFDQAFVNGREIFQPVSVLVDELFNSYLRRPGNVEPLFAAFCNGTTVTCEGLSQWGTVDLAKQGFTPYEILTYYYGDNLEIVKDAPIAPNVPSYPDRPLREGDSSDDVRAIQIRLRTRTGCSAHQQLRRWRNFSGSSPCLPPGWWISPPGTRSSTFTTASKSWRSFPPRESSLKTYRSSIRRICGRAWKACR